MSTEKGPEQISAALAAPFDQSEVKFKPSVVKGTRAMALPYVDARVIQNRLDEAVGVLNWQDDYEVLEDGSVICRLRLRIGLEWVTKVDVGGPSEQPDGGDRRKAAFSDALKRAAVKFGVGRYLYRLRAQWCDYDQAKRQFTTTPKLPASAIPTRAIKKATGPRLKVRVEAKDKELTEEGLQPAGALLAYLESEGGRANMPRDLARWSRADVIYGIKVVQRYERSLRERSLREQSPREQDVPQEVTP